MLNLHQDPLQSHIQHLCLWLFPLQHLALFQILVQVRHLAQLQVLDLLQTQYQNLHRFQDPFHALLQHLALNQPQHHNPLQHLYQHQYPHRLSHLR